MKTRKIFLPLEMITGTAAYLYATILLYQSIGLWAIAVGTSFFVVTYIAIFLALTLPNKKDN